jgi:RNA polymerase sigma-70 factor, ECF subfamily
VGTTETRRPLAELYDGHGAGLYRYALVLVGREKDAEDVVQNVFARLAAQDGHLAGIRDARAYLFRAVRNEAASWLRDRLRRRETCLQTADYLVSAGPKVSDDRRRRLGRALDRLPAEQREAVALHAFEGMTFAEVGGLLGESPNTVASRYRLAVARLTEWLRE